MTNEFNPDWLCVCGDLTTLGIVHRKDGPCYIPDKREWVGLTDDEVDALESATDTLEFPQTVKAIEAKLRSKNNDS